MPAPSQLNAGFIIHFCRIFATTPHHPLLSHLWNNYFSFRLLFPSVAFLPPLYIYPTDVLQARAYRSVLCQAQPVCILSAQRSYSKIPAICSQKQKKGTFICIYGKKVVPLHPLLNESP
jgi:hypothetical protein